MEKLKKVIKDNSDWIDLNIYVDRIESHIEVDFSLSVENAKSLLESIGKEICKQNGKALPRNPKFNGVIKGAFSSMGFSSSASLTQISSALATIAQQVGVLRNEIGMTSHGKPLDQIKERNNKVDLLTREFLMDTIETISIFLIRNFESRKAKKILNPELNYLDEEEFNDSWDDSFGEFEMGDYSYPASEILFNVDKQAYINEHKVFKETPA